MTECIIKEQKIKGAPISDLTKHVAHIMNQPAPRASRTVRYVNLLNNEEYRALSGGLAWPGKVPGFSLVLAVKQDSEDKEPIFKILEEVEEKSVVTLLKRSFDLYQKWGKNCNEIPWTWYGDPDHGLNKFIYQFNQYLEKKGFKKTFGYLSYSFYPQEKNQFERMCQLISSLSQKGNPRIDLANCHKLRSHLERLDDKQVWKSKPEEFPAIAALGYPLAWFHEIEPWILDPVGFEETVPTTWEDFAEYHERQEMKRLGFVDEPEFPMDEAQYEDDGKLRPTRKE